MFEPDPAVVPRLREAIGSSATTIEALLLSYQPVLGVPDEMARIETLREEAERFFATSVEIVSEAGGRSLPQFREVLNLHLVPRREARTSREAAKLLDISPATVETHRARILQKLDIHNTAELVLYAVRRGVIS